MSAAAAAPATTFAEREDAKLNQYWYSPATIVELIREIQLQGTKVAFLSTPSLFFSLTDTAIRTDSRVFEFDRRWGEDPCFVFYDFNAPEHVPVHLLDAFDMVVVDPPFITRDVWSKYMQTVKLILRKHGKVLFTSVLENHEMLEAHWDGPLYVADFQPSIPHLTYQYHCFVNYPLSGVMSTPNPEVPAEDSAQRRARNMANDLRESETAFTAQMRTRARDGEQVLPSVARAAAAAAVPPSSGAAAPTPSAIDDMPISHMKWNYVPAGLTEQPLVAASEPLPATARYTSLANRRQLMEEYKKHVDHVVKQIDKLVKLRTKARKLPAESECAAQIPAMVSEVVSAPTGHLACMRQISVDLAALDSADAHGVCRVMVQSADAFAAAATNEAMTEENFREMCADATRNYKSPIFNRQKELLAEMKTETAAQRQKAGVAPTSATAASAS